MLRILLIDDNPDDRLLAIRELKREFTDVQVEQIVEQEGLARSLNAANFDIAITDYQLRWNDGITVLRTLKQHYSDCPVIMFTNSGSQEVAVEAMKSGLDDYVIKSPRHYVRLAATVRSLLQRVEERRRSARLEIRLQSLLNRVNVGVFRSTLDGRLLEANAAFLQLLGVSTLEQAQSLELLKLFLEPQERSQLLEGLQQEVQLATKEVELPRADGTRIWVSWSATLSTAEGETFIDGLVEDITERKQVQEILQRANDELELQVAERTQSLRQANEQLLDEIQERKQAQEELHKSEERYRQVVELCPDAIFIQSGGQFVFVNSAAVNLYGATSPSDLIGRPVMEVVHPDYREIVRERMQQLQEGKPVGMMEQKWLRLDGNVIDVEAAAAPFTYFDARAAQVVVRDISDRKRIEQELRQSLQKERELSELKSRLITTISHEYRTPLTSILSSAELLENYAHKWTEEKKQHHLRRIQSNCKHLTDLVSDVLFIGKAEAERMEFNPAPLDLEQLCRELVEQMRSESKNQIPIIFESRGNCSDASMDEKLVRQILTNLLSNAIKYSPDGGTVRFDLECVASLQAGGSPGIARFRIQDSGIGIPAEDLPRLFESFHRASNVETIPGTGLGLTIVKKCVDLHGGQITVESVVNVGTTLTVMLPL